MRISDWSSDVCSSDLPVDHVADLCLGRSGEIFLGIGAAHRIAEIGIERRQRPLVAAALLWRTGQARAVKGEMRGVDRAGQYVRMAVDLVEGQPVFPVVERMRRDARRQAGDRAGQR